MSDNGKGSKRRPAAVSQQTYLQNWDNTFGPHPGQGAAPPDGGQRTEKPSSAGE